MQKHKYKNKEYKGWRVNFLECFKVRNSEKIKESYMVEGNRITVNISKEKYDKLLYSFIDSLDEPCFFILESPLSIDEERELQGEELRAFHYNVYYIDGLFKVELKDIFNKFLKVFKNCGVASFGAASHFAKDEILFTKYNVAYIYTKNILKYSKLLNDLEIFESNNFITAWDTFNHQTPGDAFDLNTNDNNVYTFIDYATSMLGMYKAEIR